MVLMDMENLKPPKQAPVNPKTRSSWPGFWSGFSMVAGKSGHYRTTGMSPVCVGSWAVPRYCVFPVLKLIGNVSMSY